MKKYVLALMLAMFSVSSIQVAQAATSHHHVTKKKKKRAAPAKKVAADPIPDNAVKWQCDDNENLYILGNMKRDQILTMHWKGKNYRLPRQATTTGADRFYDPASGMDLVVIPSKGMLFSRKEDTRLADECMTDEMRHQGAPAPTQSNELNLK